MSTIGIICIVLAVLVLVVQVINIIVWLLRRRNADSDAVAEVERQLVGIFFDTEMVKSIYKVGEELNCDGLVAYAQYNTEPYRVAIEEVVVETIGDFTKRKDKKEEVLIDDICHILIPPDMDHAGTQIVRGVYNGQWTSYNISIEEEAKVVNVYNEVNVAEQAASTVADDLDSAQMISIMETGAYAEADTGGVIQAEDGTAIFFNYNKSFTAKLIQADDETRAYYNEIKNFALSYKKVKAKISWAHENIRCGLEKVCRLVLRGKSLYVYLPLNADDYIDSKYKIDKVDSKRYEDFGLVYKIKNARRSRYATELIATVMENLEGVRIEKEYEDYTADYPYEETLPLIKRGLVKVTRSTKTFSAEELNGDAVQQARPIAASAVRIGVRNEINVAEAKRLMLDTEVESMIGHSERVSDPTNKGVVDIDVLSQYFDDGETVTLEAMKERIPNFDKKMTYVKVLARGTLNKQLTLEVDEIHSDAAKMVILMGGQVLKTKA